MFYDLCDIFNHLDVVAAFAVLIVWLIWCSLTCQPWAGSYSSFVCDELAILSNWVCRNWVTAEVKSVLLYLSSIFIKICLNCVFLKKKKENHVIYRKKGGVFYVDLQKLLGLHVLIIGGVVLIILSLWRIDYCREFWRSLKSIVRIYIIYYHDTAIIKIYIIKNYTGSTMLCRILFSSIVVSDRNDSFPLLCGQKYVSKEERSDWANKSEMIETDWRWQTDAHLKLFLDT